MGYLAPPPEPAPVVVVRDIGGVVADYRRQTEVYRRQNREVRLGECRSACTLALSLPNVCVYKSSVLRFHQAYDWNTKEIDYRVSDQLFQSYPPAVRARLGYLTRKYKSLTGAELIRLGIRDCNAPGDRDSPILVARRKQQDYVAPGQGPVARFLSRVAGNLFTGAQTDQTPVATVRAPIRAVQGDRKEPMRVAARARLLPELGPEPPRRPVDLAGAPMQLTPVLSSRPVDAENHAPQRKLASHARTPALPRIITGAWPVLPEGLSAYAPVRSLLPQGR